MATLLNMLDDLRDRLNDGGDTQVPLATKKRYLNHGVRATWPKLYRTVRDTTVTLVADTFEYAVPASVGNNGKILRIEVEEGVAENRYHLVHNFRLLPGLTDPILELEGPDLPSPAGSRIRFTACRPLTELVNDNDVYDGPAQTDELPVLYAMGLALTRRLDDRLDHRRLSSVSGMNQVGPDEIMTAGQFNFAQFELLLERFAMPLLPVEG